MKEKMEEYDVKYLRYVYCHDMVPRAPYDDEVDLFFEHWGPFVYYNSFYEGEVSAFSFSLSLNALSLFHFKLTLARLVEQKRKY
jgi:hypothetical protein